MTNPSSAFHPRPIANEPPRKRVKQVHESRDYPPNHILPDHLQPPAIMALPNPTATNTYIAHASLDTISNKIKKLQSDLSHAAAHGCFGPGKQNVLDCKHDVDVLAGMVKGLDVQGASRKESLDLLVEASIDQLFDTYVDKAVKVVNKNTHFLIEDALSNDLIEKGARAAVKESLKNEPDVLLDFETKFMRHLRQVLADAVARLAAEQTRHDVLYQLEKFV